MVGSIKEFDMEVKQSSGKGLKLESFEPMKVARVLMGKVFSTVRGGKALLNVGGSSWLYKGDRWVEVDRTDLEDIVHVQLEDAFKEVPLKEGNGVRKVRWAADGSYVRKNGEVVRCLETLSQTPNGGMPMWIGAVPDGMPAEKCIAFRDVVVGVNGGKKVVMPRDEKFFSTSIVDVEYGDGVGKSELWEQCLMDWMPHDEGGRLLLKRWFGYLMMNDRGYQRGLLHLGKVRSGKGTCTDVAKRLVGDARYHGRTLEDMAGPWAMEGFHRGGMLVIAEVSELTRSEGQQITKVLKHCIGQDTVMIPRKYGRNMHGVRLKLAPWICGNEMPGLSNRGQGISGKLLPLKFNVSFLGKENVNLGKELASEEQMRGIAIWALEGALELEGAEVADRWPQSVEGAAVMEEFLMGTNVYEMFLQSQFVNASEGFVGNKTLKGLWQQWCKSQGVKPPVALLHLPKRLRDEASWDLEMKKRNGVRGLAGLSIKKDAVRGESDWSL
jgi:phage/plasmid-associated DNA primase